MRSDHKIGTMIEFPIPKETKMRTLYNNTGQIVKKIIKNIYFIKCRWQPF